MAIFSVWVINKAGGLVFQRSYAGEYLAGGTIGLTVADGLAASTSNEALVLAGTLHGIHAITSRISPVLGSSGVNQIEAETFKMTIKLTQTGVLLLSSSLTL